MRAYCMVSSVADIATSCRSGRSTERASSVSVRDRSMSRLRSCTSSNSTTETPDSPGSCCSIRTNTPSVTTSIRVAALTRVSSRMRYPMVSPTRSPSVAAIRVAAARAATRRGSVTMIRPPSGSPSAGSSRGRRVVLPLPGGATTTADPDSASAAATSPAMPSIGKRSGSGRMGRLVIRRLCGSHPAVIRQ